MKITQMYLDDFGIYHQISWQPPGAGLIVMHGHNESGKTTLMKYVRSMFFGYLRGDWRGYFGHMDICRADGKEYTIYRNEKESYMMDGETKITEEPAELWWHGLDRQTYDKIFAMGLEDLQGFKILSNEEVRSHFFSMESGICMGMTRQSISKSMGELLVASPQGKKPINALLQEQKEFDVKIRGMAYDEQEFADLQVKERETHDAENRIRIEIEETKLQIERISMPIAAWDVYKRGQEALRQMQLLADVAQFPEDGAQQWSELDGQIKDIARRIQALEKTGRSGPAFQEEWKRWLVAGSSLEDMYQHVMPWQEGLKELAAHEDAETDWQFELNKQEALLKPYVETVVPESVDWHRGIHAAEEVQRYEQEIARWQEERPKNMSSLPQTEAGEGKEERTQEEWEAVGKSVSAIQGLLMERQKIQEQLTWLQHEPVSSSHGLLYAAILLFAGMAAFLGLLFWQQLDMYPSLGGAAVCAVLGLICFLKKGNGPARTLKRQEELQGQLAAVQAKLEKEAEEAHLNHSADESNEVWTQTLDDIRRAYLDWKTRESKNAWEKEQQVMYDAIFAKWERNGKSLQEKLSASQAAWLAWKQTTGFVHVRFEDIQHVRDIWDAWQAAGASLSQWLTRKNVLTRQIALWHDTAEQLFREVGETLSCTPEHTEQVYKKWQEIRIQAEVAKEQDKQQAERSDQITQLKREKELKEQQQQLLLTRTGAQTAGEFRSKLLKFRQFQQYKEIFDQSEAHIRLIAKNPKNLAALRHELKIHTIKNWTEERTYYEKKIADAEKKLNEAAEKRGSIIERLSQMAKSDAYNKLLQEKQHRKAALDTCVNEWLTLAFAQHMLAEAQTYYEQVRQPVVIRTASDYLHLMTQGRYTLQASFDGKELYAVDGSQRRIPEKQWSSGLGDQIYLAIRISLAMAFSKQMEPMPLILDDILVRFDEQRQREALHFLADLGKKEQIFLFTCSKATRDIAAAVQREFAGETDTIHLFTIEKGTIKEDTPTEKAV